jgi:hypothetical protein
MARIDPARWRPLIMSFCRFFGLGSEVHPSRLTESDFMKFVTQGIDVACGEFVGSRKNRNNVQCRSQTSRPNG